MSSVPEHVPPPSTPLLDAVAVMKATRTRVPVRQLAIVAAIGLIGPIAVLIHWGPRRDLPYLPVAWVAVQLVIWATGFVVPLALALVPPLGQVLPSSGRAVVAGLVVVAALIAQGVLLTVNAPGHTIVPAATFSAFLSPWKPCTTLGVELSLPVLVAGVIALRRVALVASTGLGVGLGAAAGALAGLTQQALCPVGGRLHVTLGHGVTVLIGAAIGAVLLPLLRKR
jgi:hypothetical protein